ncbi:MAG: hypothetical protein AABW58_02520 [Nanoarchaeota archaeon]
MPVKFIFDEELERNRKQLQSIIDFMDEDIETKRKADVLLTITWGAVRSFVKTQPITIQEEIKKPDINQSPVTLLNKLFGKRDIQPVVKKIPEKPKEIKVEKPVGEKPPEPQVIEKNLIMDKMTDKVLASVKVLDKYILIEPVIDENDNKVLARVLKEKPKNMEKGWKLINKYLKKFNSPPDHATNIKYYVVNFLFGLGKLEPLVYDKDITEIICEGTNKPLKVKYTDKVLETNIVYAKKEDLDNFIYSVAYRAKPIGLFSQNKKITKKAPNTSFSYRDMAFECSVGFEKGSDSKFTVRKTVQPVSQPLPKNQQTQNPLSWT